MADQKFDPRKPDAKLAAVCGLFCPSCSLYIGTTEEPERLEQFAKRIGMPKEELICHGCRAEKRSFFCRNICKMYSCAGEKGIDFCGECDEYPCEELKAFQIQYPHRIELLENLERIREAGLEKWYEEMVAHYSCPSCGAINSAYDIPCRKCGNSPSCEYVRLHEKEIIRADTALLPEE